jgi:Fic family protein
MLRDKITEVWTFVTLPPPDVMISNDDTPAAITPLGHYERHIWQPDPGAYGGRKAKRGGPYEVFIPEGIADRRFTFSDDTVAAIADAIKELGRLNGTPPRLASLEALARNLLRAEGVASSRIEGLTMSHQRLARAVYADTDSPGGDKRAADVVGNVRALEQAIALGAAASPLRVQDICDIHRTLLRFTFDQKVAGTIRTKENWIGGSDYNPLTAAYVPPPHELVAQLLTDLCGFIERDDVAPIAQAAIAHAQFETIHPFADGNGRVGRALIYTVLRRGGEATRFIPPISLVLGQHKDTYIQGLEAFRGGAIDDWCAQFAGATTRAAYQAELLADAIEALEADWIARLGSPRSDAASRQLISALPAHPVLDVKAAQQITGKSHVAVGKALAQLEQEGILSRLSERKWGRVWECAALFDLVTDFEQAITTPA